MFLVHEMIWNSSKVVDRFETEVEASNYLQERYYNEDDIENHLSYFSIEDDGRELIDEDKLLGMYDYMLDECYPEMFNMSASTILYRADKIAYDCGLSDYYESISDSYYCAGME
jgi:hypothetical protein